MYGKISCVQEADSFTRKPGRNRIPQTDVTSRDTHPKDTKVFYMRAVSPEKVLTK